MSAAGPAQARKSAPARSPTHGPDPALVPEPAPGSVRFFTLLYAAPERRGALRTLLALADEIGAGLGRRLDHGVAHVRLDWWQQEAQRLAAGHPAHPWLIARQREPASALDLTPLIDAAAIDLASERLAGSASRQLPQALFVQAARVLTAGTPAAALADQQEAMIGALGRAVDALERPPGDSSDRPQEAGALQAGPSRLEPSLQRALAPLLVWAALAARQARRRERRVAKKSSTITGSMFDGLIDNLVAWHAARAAQRGRFRLEDLQGMGK
ncbi:MAG TPA: hypothetical protein VHX52_02595 [Steroidobacteraceae bacterium]|jgi:hypothetical protein|nr:hypothetical protein [Steroidobacteraceae bacterium]